MKFLVLNFTFDLCILDAPINKISVYETTINFGIYRTKLCVRQIYEKFFNKVKHFTYYFYRR